MKLAEIELHLNTGLQSCIMTIIMHFLPFFFQKLVNETFQNMWFTPVNEREENITAIFRTKVMNITDVVNACKDTGYEWFEHLLENVSTVITVFFFDI